MRNRSRLEKLEEKHGRECPQCGFTGDYSTVKYEVRLPEPGARPAENEHCLDCGRPTRIVLRWD